MILCDLCDRWVKFYLLCTLIYLNLFFSGYHSFCVGFSKPPKGDWFCQHCAHDSDEESEDSRKNRQFRQPKKIASPSIAMKLERKSPPKFYNEVKRVKKRHTSQGSASPKRPKFEKAATMRKSCPTMDCDNEGHFGGVFDRHETIETCVLYHNMTMKECEV